MNKTSIPLNIILIFLILYILKATQNIILPFVVALFLWALIYILDGTYRDLFIKKLKLPNWTRFLSKILSIITITGIIYFIVVGIKSNIGNVSETFSKYQQNIGGIINRFTTYLNLKPINTTELLQEINIPKLINSVVQNFASFLSSTTMVLLYVIFLILEEKSIIKKLPLLFKDKKNLAKVNDVAQKIFSKIRIYILVKFYMSLLTAIISYIGMISVNLDFALFWAILIFLLNFIPNIGSIISTAFPMLFSLLQYNDTFLPFMVVSIVIISAQLIIGNFLDPKLTGSTLNLSPVILILSLVIWGYIWGIIGMFLSVPLMIILIIILNEIPKTKKLAIILAEDGETL